MRLLNQEGQQKCLIYSLAMILDRDVEDIEAGLPKTDNRSHHIQEIIDYLWPEHKLLRIEPYVFAGGQLVYNQEAAERRWLHYIGSGKGLIICNYGPTPTEDLHCVATDGKMIYDPNGMILPIDSARYTYHEFYLLI